MINLLLNEFGYCPRLNKSIKRHVLIVGDGLSGTSPAGMDYEKYYGYFEQEIFFPSDLIMYNGR